MHCYAGQSRSSTLVMAYLIERAHHLSCLYRCHLNMSTKHISRLCCSMQFGSVHRVLQEASFERNFELRSRAAHATCRREAAAR